MKSCLSLAVMAGGLLLVGASASADPQPPIEAPMGTIPVVEGTVQTVSEGARTVVVKTADGIKHLFHLTERTAVHGGAEAGDIALRGLDEGTSVVVHYTQEGDRKIAHEVDRIAGDGLHAIEGVVTNVDRRRQTISVQLADGSQQTLRLTERAASGAGKDIDGAAAGTAKVIVYFTDEAGQRVAHYFKRVS